MNDPRDALIDRSTCLNCGADLGGLHCSVCGQASESPIKPLFAFLRGSLFELLSWDGTQLRTLRILLTKPGALSVEYLDGKRATYVHPVRLFVEVGVGTYFLTRLIPTDFDLFGMAPDLFADSPDPRAWLASCAFIVGGAFAHWAALRQARPMVMEHVVFLLHVLTFSFLLAPVEGVLYLVSGEVALLQFASFFVAPLLSVVYWLLALRRFLGHSTLQDTYLSGFQVYGVFLLLVIIVQALAYVQRLLG